MADEHRAVRLRIGRRIKEIRLLQGLTQETLAGLLGRDQKDVSSLERGTVNMTIESLAGVAAVLSIDIADLIQPTAPSGKRRGALSIMRRDLDHIERALRIVERVKHAGKSGARAKRSRPKSSRLKKG
jgi:transcriptional regulator with XRE-family HTH domain